MSATDADIREALDDLNSLTFSNKITNTGANRARVIETSQTIQLTEFEEYDSTKGEKLIDFDFEIGDNKKTEIFMRMS